MKLIRPNQVSGMNIHYKFYSLEYFLESQMRAGFKTIELWAGSPHFFLSNLEYDDCKKVSKMARERGLTIQVITPENCTVPYQFAAGDPDLYAKSFEYFKKGLDAGNGSNIRDVFFQTGCWNGNSISGCIHGNLQKFLMSYQGLTFG